MKHLWWALVLLAAPVFVAVAEPVIVPKSPVTYSWQTYAWVLGLSLWGGIVAHIRKYSDGHPPKARIASLIVDVAGSGLAGMLVFLACEHYGFDQLVTAVLVGISGHMGARALFFIEKLAVRFWDRTGSSIDAGTDKPGE